MKTQLEQLMNLYEAKLKDKLLFNNKFSLKRIERIKQKPSVESNDAFEVFITLSELGVINPLKTTLKDLCKPIQSSE